MRHNKKYNHLSRKSGHRKALLANMASSLIMHKRIETTLAKAKALRMYVEPLITKAKEAIKNETVTVVTKTVTVKHRKPEVIQKYGEESQVERKLHIKSSSHARRVVFSYLKDNDALKILFGEIAQKVADREGGYTRILKTGFRQGDAADMAMIELVDFNEAALGGSAKKEIKKTTRRSRAKKVTDATIVEEKVTEKKADKTPKEIQPAKEEEPSVADVESNTDTVAIE
ncbi:MAG: 50S ribosomal protein L17 [Prevotellaceae bacterium]|jgi:large subunit ribosomal protein L17|nr:50S ribosomal protein L17 [Prevotellaceae bacterium]